MTSDYTSNHLKAKTDSRPARNVIEGVAQGTEYATRTIVHGAAGLIGNPYRLIKQGGLLVRQKAKGTVSGVAGAFFSPFIGALGFVAKASEGIGENSKILNLGEYFCVNSISCILFSTGDANNLFASKSCH